MLNQAAWGLQDGETCRIDPFLKYRRVFLRGRRTDTSQPATDETGRTITWNDPPNGNARIDFISAAKWDYGSGLTTNGDSNSFARVPHTADLNVNNSTHLMISCWFRRPSDMTRRLINKDGGSGAYYPNYSVSIGPGDLWFGVGNSNGNDPNNWTEISYTAPSNFADDWNYFVATKVNMDIRIFLNGAQVAGGNLGSKTVNGAGRPLYMLGPGSFQGAAMTGYICDLGIYTSTEDWFYTTAFTPPSLPPC